MKKPNNGVGLYFYFYYLVIATAGIALGILALVILARWVIRKLRKRPATTPITPVPTCRICGKIREAHVPETLRCYD